MNMNCSSGHKILVEISTFYDIAVKKRGHTLEKPFPADNALHLVFGTIDTSPIEVFAAKKHQGKIRAKFKYGAWARRPPNVDFLHFHGDLLLWPLQCGIQ